MARFVPNPMAAALLSRTTAMQRTLLARASAAAAAARGLAPVKTGDYRGSIEGAAGVDSDGKLKGRVLARDFKANWVEFGTIKQAAHGTLRRAVESIGLRITGGR